MRHSENLSTSLHVNGLTLWVRLGCEAEERVKPQEVKVDVHLEFLVLSQACASDDLKDTICYDDIAQLLRRTVLNKEYKLIECLGFELYRAVLEIILKDYLLELAVTKVRPPIAELQGGVTFKIKTIAN